MTWKSPGYHQDVITFERLGRTTVTLKKSNLNSKWKGIHTHFSLNRGVPQQSFGNFK
ncbi:hypothetical protein OA087_00730 [bacterium]|nr:hypothetical protein [bacterium]